MTHAGSGASTLDLNGVLAALGIKTQNSGTHIPYTVMRGHNGPRWLIPHASPLAQTILKEWRPYGLRARLHWLMASLAQQLGALRLMPGATGALLPPDAGAQLLRHIGMDGEAGPPIVLIGNSVATRKALVFFEDGALEKSVLVKVPLMPMARASIQCEARTLRNLNGRLHAPRLLRISEDAGASMQEYLPGRLGSRRCKPQYVELLAELAETGSDISLREHGQHLAGRLRACASYAENAAHLDAALALLDRDAALPAVLVHGDFAPWNIKELPDGSCALIDWELARERGLPLYDLCHFYYMQFLLFNPQKLFYTGLLEEESWRGYFDRLAIPHALLPGLAAAFLLEILAGYWEIPETSVDRFCLHQLKLFLEFIRNHAQ